MAASLVGLVLLAATAPAAAAEDQPLSCEARSLPGESQPLSPGDRLTAGQTLATDKVKLVVQADGNVVLHLWDQARGNGLGPALWSTGTWGNPGAYLLMQADGNLVVYREGGGPTSGGALWSTHTWGIDRACARIDEYGDFAVRDGNGQAWSPSNTRTVSSNPGMDALWPADWGSGASQWLGSRTAWLVHQKDGNLVLYRKSDGRPLWATGTSGDLNSIELQRDGNLVVYSPGAGPGRRPVWATGTWGNPGAYGLLQDDGNFVLYREGGGPSAGGALWSTGTWGRV
ncbi:hypothetical protein GCM10020229_51130 [Kitasatospora albolonga]|uniref:hypothetical protein n=1 Tax=Kitasatospora albolonga TaxID=68173 RepID=UPI0031F112C6